MGGASSTIRPNHSSSSSSESPSDDVDDNLEEPSAKKGRKNGVEVSIEALGQIWDLEIISAKKSPVLKNMFETMFHDNVEGQTIKVNITDSNITSEGLHQVFLCICNHSTDINLENVQDVLSAAIYLNVEDAINICVEVYRNDFSKETVLDYYRQSLICNLEPFKIAVMDYLLANFCKFAQDLDFLNVIHRDLFKLLISNGRLCVWDAEYSVYKLIKKFIMLDQLRIHDVDVTPGDDFPTFIASVNSSFSPAIYYDLLQEVRIQHCVNSIITINEFKEDKLIPEYVLKDILADTWISNLSASSSPINEDETIDLKKFDQECMRLGKTIEKQSQWYWFRCIFGIDLEFKYVKGNILVNRKFKREQMTNLSNNFFVYICGTLCDTKGKVNVDLIPKQFNLTPRQDHIICEVPEDLNRSPFTFNFMMLPIKKSQILPIKAYFKKHVGSCPHSRMNRTSNSHDIIIINEN